jgi:uncharacterized NAD(P)/FAD-binding protein YdhS
MHASEMMSQSFRIAIVGGGPRGVSVLERLACGLSAETKPSSPPVTIYLIDDVEVGAGRIWRTDQPSWLIMNTISSEVTMFSGLPDEGAARPGAGPSLDEWWRSADPDGAADHPYGPYAPRSVYGKYLSFVVDTIDEHLKGHGVTLVRVDSSVTRLMRSCSGGYRLFLADESALSADRVVLATGQSMVPPIGTARELADAARQSRTLTYIHGDSAAEMDLAKIQPGERTGIIGLGLGFYDIVASLTVGRGGTFRDAGPGRAVYQASGAEPRIMAGSRSGCPFLARGRNQKPPDYRYQSRLLTRDRILTANPDRRLDFCHDVFPWVVAEVHLVYFETLARVRTGAASATEFARAVVAALNNTALNNTALNNTALNNTGLNNTGGDPVQEVGKIAAAYGLHDAPCPDLHLLARPFSATAFESQAAFTATLTAHLQNDLALALEGNTTNPLKAALDTLRDIRPVIRSIMEFDGASARSYGSGFLEFFAPIEALLTAGPPTARVIELLALMEAGVIEIVGSDLQIRADRQRDRYVIWSPQVRNAFHSVSAIVDSRVPKTDIRQDENPLIRQLLQDGLIRTHVISDSCSQFDTGGVDITPRPYHPIRRDGSSDRNMYVVGMPTEGSRWYTQIGSGRPGYWNDFTRDADSIAVDLITAIKSGAHL